MIHALQILVRLLLAVFFTGVGYLHFKRPQGFCKIVPPPLPALPCVYLSGAAEMLGGVGLLVCPKTAGWGLIALLIAVFPANIYMAAAQIKVKGMPTKPWQLWLRVSMQPLFCWIVWWAACQP
jgi:uncharacterized membrane protein